jgi:hypothetical protein
MVSRRLNKKDGEWMIINLYLSLPDDDEEEELKDEVENIQKDHIKIDQPELEEVFG